MPGHSIPHRAFTAPPDKVQRMEDTLPAILLPAFPRHPVLIHRPNQECGNDMLDLLDATEASRQDSILILGDRTAALLSATICRAAMAATRLPPHPDPADIVLAPHVTSEQDAVDLARKARIILGGGGDAWPYGCSAPTPLSWPEASRGHGVNSAMRASISAGRAKAASSSRGATQRPRSPETGNHADAQSRPGAAQLHPGPRHALPPR